MDKLFERKTSWTSPGGDCKLLELENFKISKYYENDSLTISEEESDDLISQIRTVVNCNNPTNETLYSLWQQRKHRKQDYPYPKRRDDCNYSS